MLDGECSRCDSLSQQSPWPAYGTSFTVFLDCFVVRAYPPTFLSFGFSSISSSLSAKVGGWQSRFGVIARRESL
ncbi:hypothetical protein KDK_10910 [Dictyobacter kobayashii]|uniref:Uncharacterized protein n=1 Tax=Dictyobacter kobayashii TaxID=2014872 RepID=A0A402ADX2_9CHLR|nr:hypothetical protein KDK_10910 [Dictyobacter kobayashii]